MGTDGLLHRRRLVASKASLLRNFECQVGGPPTEGRSRQNDFTGTSCPLQFCNHFEVI